MASKYFPDYTSYNYIKPLRTEPTAKLLPENNALPLAFSVCIIGASRGIGAHIALSYARAGATTVIVTATTMAGLDSVAQQIAAVSPTIAIVRVAADISRDADVAHLAAEIRAHVPDARLDAVVVNAAYYGELVVDIASTDPKEFQRCLDVNAAGPFLAAHYLVPLLLGTKDGAKSFIAISSTAAWMVEGLLAHLAVCVSKLAQVRIVEHLAAQYGPQGLTAVSVHPGCVKTDMAEAAPAEFKEFLTDEPGLCGAVCVWISRNRLTWLNGRFVCATWDPDALLAKREDIEKRDLLKARIAL